jgi:hypothetical protein
MRQETKIVCETQAIANALDEKIAKLTQMRELLADPAIVVLVKEIFQKTTTPTVRTLSGAAAPHLRRPLSRTAYEAVQSMDGPFTKVDVAERMKQMAGYVCENPKDRLHSVMKTFVDEGIVNLIEQGGARRPNKYEKCGAIRSIGNTELSGNDDQQEEQNNVAASELVVPRGLRLRGAMLATAFQCVHSFDQPFAPHDLIRKMRAAGYTFVGNCDLSIQNVLRKLVKEGILEIAQEGAGERPTMYQRRDATAENVAHS